MKTVSLKIPDTVDLDDKDIAMIVASTLYEKGKLSLGQAADLAGLSKATFAELLGKYGVSIFNYPPSDLSREHKECLSRLLQIPEKQALKEAEEL
ncbi:MAG: UPF0175 family protein [Bacteroidales bacterium]|nr:UPF0175 family protein [Bacteroidales bacterium]